MSETSQCGESTTSIDEVVRTLVEALANGKKPTDWSFLKTPEDAKKYYDGHFKGMNRGQVGRDALGGGRGFYQKVRKLGWLDEVLPDSLLTDWSFLKTSEDARKYYDEHFKGMTRGQLSEDDVGGGSRFYQKVCKLGWVEDVFPESRKKGDIDWSFLKTPDDARKYYEQHFRGMSRKQVEECKPVGGRFYDKITTLGWSDDVFPESIKKDNTDWSFLKTSDDARRYYEEHFQGMSRRQVQTDDVGGGIAFYAKVGRLGWRDAVFPESKNKGDTDWSFLKTSDDARRYYEEHFQGMNRGQVERDALGGGRGFYQKVRELGWLDDVFPPSKRAKKER